MHKNVKKTKLLKIRQLFVSQKQVNRPNTKIINLNIEIRMYSIEKRNWEKNNKYFNADSN